MVAFGSCGSDLPARALTHTPVREEFGSAMCACWEPECASKNLSLEGFKRHVDVVLRNRAWQCWVNRSNDLNGLLQPKLFHESLIHQKLKKPLWFYEWTHTLPELTHSIHILLIKIAYHHPLRMAWGLSVPKDLRGISPLCPQPHSLATPESPAFQSKAWQIFTQLPLLFVRYVFKLDTWRLNHCKLSSNQ